MPDEKYAYAVKRLDRNSKGRVHIEDFAQVFGFKLEEKYTATNHETMARLITEYLPNAKAELAEFLRRMFFNILIGNTDAHLKN